MSRDKKPLVVLLLAITCAVFLPMLNINISNAEDKAAAPKVPFKYAKGVKQYNSLCKQCHGEWGEGSKQGPPLMHPFYKPSHHADSSFYRAVLKGVQAHHWEFGDMPPVQSATRADVDAIVPFIRWLQREKGLIK